MQKEVPQDIPKDLQRLARLLDSQFRIGNFRFGLDPLLGLIPGIGDFISLSISGGFLALAAKHGASRKLLILMALNVLLDAIIGTIPIFGQIFDFLYKANNRNARLLQRYYHKGKYRGSGKGVIAIIIISVLLIAALFIFLMWKLIEWLAGLI
ncbi:MAG: DUF4112 domain-containing protein [Mariniphaga sp.]